MCFNKVFFQFAIVTFRSEIVSYWLAQKLVICVTEKHVLLNRQGIFRAELRE